jgi:hypothetical protein
MGGTPLEPDEAMRWFIDTRMQNISKTISQFPRRVTLGSRDCLCMTLSCKVFLLREINVYDNICPAAAAAAAGPPATAAGAEQEGGYILQDKKVITPVQPQSYVFSLHGLACQAFLLQLKIKNINEKWGVFSIERTDPCEPLLETIES